MNQFNFSDLIQRVLGLFALAGLASAAPTVESSTVGNVTTTCASVCWEASETANPGLRVFSDAAGTMEITDQVAIEFQALMADRREVASTSATRDRARVIQGAMSARLVFLAKISGLDPDTEYWVQATVLDPLDETEDAGDLLPFTTASRSSFIVESRQLLIDMGASGDLTGTIVSLANASSPYPLFSVVGDGVNGSRVYFDLNHFLDAAGETQLNPQSGTTLSLTVGFKGGELRPGNLDGTAVAFTGTPTAALTSRANFIPDELVLVANPSSETALVGHPFPVDFRAELTDGSADLNFDRPLTLNSSALSGGTVQTSALADGVLDGQPVTLFTEGTQTVSVVDSVGGASTSFNVDVLPYTYNNFRIHYYGDTENPLGDPNQNNDGDEFNNLEEFAHGLNPGIRDSALVLGENFVISKRGGPVTSLRIDADGVDFRVTFLRPLNYQSLGLSYTPRFSSDMATWFDATTPPSVVSNDGEMELVTYEYPFFTPEARKARFFTIAVEIQ